MYKSSGAPRISLHQGSLIGQGLELHGLCWYYLISVLDDYSRLILAWDLKRDMTAASIGDVVEQAVTFTGMRHVPVQDKTRLLTDNGPGFIAQALEDYLRMQSTRHIRCSPHHPQTNGKLERFHQALKTRLNVLVYSSPEELQRAMAEFIEYYNHRRYHEGIGNVAPAAAMKSCGAERSKKNSRPRRVSGTIWGAHTFNQRATQPSKP